jgi:hypothetical protein
MMMSDRTTPLFELIGLDSGNVIAGFDSVDDALDAIRRVAIRNGWASVEHLSLMRVSGDDQIVLSMNHDLVEKARSLTIAG